MESALIRAYDPVPPRRRGVIRGFLRVGLYLVLAVLPLVLALIWGPRDRPFIWNTAWGAALVGIVLLALQSVLAGRFKWITRPFGFDMVIRFHRNMAVLALGLLLAHPVLMAFGGAGWRIIIGGSALVWVGKAALALVLVNVLLSLYQTRLGLKFERWRFLHDLTGPAILALAFTHSWFIGTDLHLTVLQALWVALLGAAVAAFGYHKFIRPRRLARDPYEVTEVKREAPKVWTVKLAPSEGRTVFDYAPGQFQFIRFLRRRGLPEEEHHWTISSSPAQKAYLSSTIKELGDFTATIGETRPGDKAVVHGPFGRFSHIFHPDETELVFIAGGVGITPVMSMIRYLRDRRDGTPVTLLYGNLDRESIIFHDELLDIERGGTPPLRVVHVLEKPDPNWAGERGFIDLEKIRRYCGDGLSGKGFYIVGPAALNDKSVRNLRAMGVRNARIHSELFSFLD